MELQTQSDLDAQVREDVRLLGDMLGGVLRAYEGMPLFDLVERVRALAKGARRGDGGDARALQELLASLDADRALPLARAFAHFLQLANVAEQRYRAHADEARADSSLGDALDQLVASGVDPARLYEAAIDLRVELVLTAHPTQVVRRTLLQKYRRIAGALERRGRAERGPAHETDVVEALRREVSALWHTDELRRRRPTPVDEARAGFALFEQVLWDALPDAARSLDRALLRATGRGLPLDRAPLRFGSWMGGDRDGNPHVTPAVTDEVCLMARWMAAELYLRDIDRLHDELSVRPCTDELRARVGDRWEPYRALLDEVLARLHATRDACEAKLAVLRAGIPAGTTSADAIADGASASRPPPYWDARELWEDLALCHRSLSESGLGGVANGRLYDVLRRVACFGVTLARLDIRQEAGAHTRALDALTRYLELGSYEAWSEEERLGFLLRELGSKRPLVPRKLPDEPALRDVLDTLAVCARQGPGSLGAYVISMASAPSDVLAVYLLQREAGVTDPLRVVPLFETLADLERAASIIERLLETPWFREAIRDELEVMVGYSDSTKDVGRLGSAWALYRAQETLVALCRARGVRLTLFHGRGGTIARGGGPLYHAVLSQPPGSVDGRLRVTIQGEAIDSTFGLAGIALHSLTRYALATLESTVAPPAPPRPEWRSVMDRLAQVGATAYARVVRGTPGFMDYFLAATPVRELALLHVGSRPAHRGRKLDLDSLRAIPWVFAWTQVRLHLPSWLGAGEALRACLEEGHGATLGEMAREWAFFGSLLELMEMVLAKADPDIAACYDAVLVSEELRPIGAELRAQCVETIEAILRVERQSRLLDADPALRRSIEVRNPYVDPLNLLQVALLRRVREQEDPRLLDALLVTVNGIAAGMRNTG